MTRAGRRHERLFLRDLYDGQGRRRASALTLVWWWRWELVVVSAAVVGPLWLVETIGRPLTVALLVATFGPVIAVRPGRRWLDGRVWVIVTPHRIRSGCAEAGIHSRTGRLPTVLWTTTTARGERLWLWCPAGVAAEDFADASERLAVACWATKVAVRRHPDQAQLVVVDVIRRRSASRRGSPPPVPQARGEGRFDDEVREVGADAETESRSTEH